MIQTFKQPDVTYRNIASLKNLQAEEVHVNVLFVNCNFVSGPQFGKSAIPNITL